jgi:hypothetical protein
MAALTKFLSNKVLNLTVAGALLGVPLAWLAGSYVGSRGLSYVEILAGLILFGGSLTVVSGEKGAHLGFLGVVIMFGLGYRTVAITGSLSLHPAELLLWALLVLLLTQHRILRKYNMVAWLPRWLWLFMPFWAVGWASGLQAGFPWDRMLAELKNFMVLIPLFLIAGTVLASQSYWRPLLLAFFATSTWIAGMGLLEYLLPGTARLFGGFVTNTAGSLAEDGFRRASFSFWGAPAATFVCLLAAPLVTICWQWWTKSWQRGLLLAAFILQLAGIYIGGYRSVWFTGIICFILWAVICYGPLWGSLLLLPSLVLYQFLPAVAQQRALSLVLAFEGTPVDTSSVKRLDRATHSWEAALQSPWGSGWSSAGWTHSDILQLAMNLGLIAALLFMGAYLVTMLRLGRKVYGFPRASRSGQLELALLLSFVSAGSLLAFQGVQRLPQLVLPVWLVWVLIEIRLRQTASTTPEV